MKVGKIERGIPIPLKNKGFGSIPFKDMKVGDSIMIITTVQNRQVHNQLSAHVCTYGHRLGMKFTVRKVVGGYRIWRIA